MFTGIFYNLILAFLLIKIKNFIGNIIRKSNLEQLFSMCKMSCT